MPRRNKNAHLEEISDEEEQAYIEMHLDTLVDIAMEEEKLNRWEGYDEREEEEKQETEEEFNERYNEICIAIAIKEQEEYEEYKEYEERYNDSCLAIMVSNQDYDEEHKDCKPHEDISWESLKGLDFREYFAKDFNERLIPLAENLVALASFYEENRRGNMALEKTGYPTKLADILANDVVDSLFSIFGIRFRKNQNIQKRRKIFEEMCIYLSEISKGWHLASLPKIETTFEKCIIDILVFIIGNDDLFEFPIGERVSLLNVFETRANDMAKRGVL